jgi:hypothetical protein
MAVGIERLKITAIAVYARCNDGTTRAVVLEGKQPKKVLGFITHIQGGKTRLTSQPLNEERRIIVPAL